MPPDPQDFPMLFSQYRWDSYHAAFGWLPDCLQDGFPWIVSLENRFKGVLEQGGVPDASSVAEVVLWGGNQNNVLGRFSRGLRELGDYKPVFTQVVGNLDDPRLALESALAIPGFGLAYASKLLRFCRPSTYGALDGRIREALANNLRRIHDGNVHSMCEGYMAFLNLIHEYQDALHLAGLSRPGYGLRAAWHDWTAAEIEMALFSWASRQEG